MQRVKLREAEDSCMTRMQKDIKLCNTEKLVYNNNNNNNNIFLLLSAEGYQTFP
jgi:hypothetical protein